MGQMRLSDDQVREKMNELRKSYPGWELHDGRLTREFKFRNFESAIDYVVSCARAAERIDHHPDIHVFYNVVRLECVTHKAGGLTDRDFELAERLDALGEGAFGKAA